MRKICVVFGFILFASGVFAQAGFTWTSSIVPAYRHVNAANCLAYDKICAVGGNENNDSITCIFLTENGGTNWTLISDTMGPWIKDQHFVNSITGFACGDDGLILKTTNGGTNWNRKMLSGNMQSRAFNGIFFIDENIGIAVGGNEWNDAITTIIRTTDGGQSWNLVMDNLGPWLRDVYFVNSTTGFAVGDNGLLLKTTDGGLNWTTLTVTGSAANRKYNAVWFTDANTGVAVGGNQSNDSIATIIRTTDGGATWNMLQDAIAPWLTDVTFISSTRGYIVGRNGTFLKTDNAGATWTVDSIPGTDANYSFNSISFLNYQYGVVGGQNGRVFIASSGSGQSPVGNTLPASTVWETFATLNAFVKPYGNDVQVYLEYGQGASFSHSIYIGNFSGTDSIPLSTNITGLAANTIYNCRLKLTSSWGTFYGDAVQFFPSNGVVPNWGFEHWTQKAWESPSGYNFVQGNVSKTTSYNSSSAVRLETEFEAGEAIPGVVGMIMVTGNAQFGPYTPFAARPDSIIAFMNYDIPSGDSAMLLCMFFEAGTPLSMDMILIGGSSGGFVRRSFPVSYNSPNTPDSIGIAFVNSNPFLQGPLAQYGWLEIDDISFSGTSENIPNNDFELWRNDTIYRPESWYYQTRDDHSALIMGEDLTITRTTDAYSGSYAIQIQNVISRGDTSIGELSTSMNPNHGADLPSFPVAAQHKTLNGYFKYAQKNGDTLGIRVSMYKNGLIIGGGEMLIMRVISSYEAFSIPISYGDTISPDSACVIIKTGYGNGQGASFAIIDHLGFDGYYDVWEKVDEVPATSYNIAMYPNPASTTFTLSIATEQSGTIQISVYNISGTLQSREMMDLQGKDQIKKTIDVSTLSNGIYFVVVQGQKYQSTHKLVIQNR